MNLILAWRNLWRNKRRTFITMASVIFAIFLAVFASSMQKGTWSHMILSVVSNYTGLLQIHKNGYWENPVIDNAFPLPDIEKAINSNDQVSALAPRLESFALASTENKTAGALVVGIHPEYEARVTRLNEKLISGKYLSSDDNSVIISEGLAKKMNLTLNDTLVLLGQGYHANSAVGKYSIKGIVKFGSVELNNNMVYLALPEAQWFYAAPQLITSLIVKPENSDNIQSANKQMKNYFGLDYEIMTWEELLPELVQAMKVDTGGLIIMFIIIYIVIGFGIFSTIVMMVAERQHEFGVLLAIGMKRLKLIFVVVVELLLLSALGILIGLVIVAPVIAYFYNHPISLSGAFAEIYESYGFEPMLVFSIKPEVFYNQALTIFLITAAVTFYPVFNLLKADAVKAMKK